MGRRAARAGDADLTPPSGTARAPHWAETLARRHVEGLGWRVVGANVLVRGGELDLVALDGATVVFVEVRQRRDARHGHPLETIGRSKRQRWVRAARRYLSQHLRRPDAACRFDAVVVLGDARAPRLRHLRDVM